MANTNKQQTFEDSNITEAFITTHKNKITAGVVAILVIIAAIVLGNKWMNTREAKAQTLLTMGQTYIQQKDYDKALNGEGAFPGYLKIASNYSMTDASNLAHYYAGVCYFQKEDYKNAIAQLDKFTTQDDHTISPQAVAVLANAYAEEGNLEKAADKFQEAARLANNDTMSPEYLVLAGELLLKLEKKQEALKVFEEIKNNYPNARYSAPQRMPNGTVTDALIDSYIERSK